MTPRDKDEIIRKCGKVNRTGLYLMVFFVLANQPSGYRFDRIENSISRIEAAISNSAPPRVLTVEQASAMEDGE